MSDGCWCVPVAHSTSAPKAGGKQGSAIGIAGPFIATMDTVTHKACRTQPLPPNAPNKEGPDLCEARAISKVYIFVGACGAEGAIVINEHEMVILYIDNHVEFAITIDILERQSHRRQVLSISDQSRANEYPGFCAITSRKFYDLYVTVQV